MAQETIWTRQRSTILVGINLDFDSGGAGLTRTERCHHIIPTAFNAFHVEIDG